MSRIGKQPVKIPAGVQVSVEGGNVHVKGPKGNLDVYIRPEINIEVVDGEIRLTPKDSSASTRAYWGLGRSLLANSILGVVEGYEKDLELVGVGYRAQKEGNDLTLTLGFSHPLSVKAPEGIEFELADNQNIKIKGIDKQLVGLTAARIRKLRKPEPYLGKGVRYKGEIVRRKAGKSAAA